MAGKSSCYTRVKPGRHEWFDALKHDEGFNIEIINENLLRTLADGLNNRI